ncbi:GlsB/YeaQ/YmgE family stress response membrane protein [Nitratidesulfovibrio sp. HK-II]|uniref:GlsB/YeaQ/YmgE family stress response membrane protein n=1 Tax=Nitratidesulfovibrio sp. HK-II TaxID=2009266 RepID=UPI000E2F6AA5|nr:GlsB/YeaQ/YmgE family stress response membrane protein [Nitratidesulfovibrio sp. HK-II]
MENLLWFLVIGLVAGWLAGALMKGGGFGLVGDLIVGIIGAVIGGVLFGAAGVGGGGLLGAILMATVGAVILILCLRLLKRA